MFAVLGDIEFELITYWDGFEATFGVDYAEHPVSRVSPACSSLAISWTRSR